MTPQQKKARIQTEDSLKHLHECEYRGQPVTPESVAGALACGLDESAALVGRLEASGLLEVDSGTVALTAKGRDYARQVIRAHRLYETYLARETGLDETQWHHQAEKAEHTISREEAEAMSRQLGHPRYDPHGDPIPTRSGELPPVRGVPVLDCPEGWEGRVVHIEDEPASFYNQLVHTGVAVGTRIQVLARDVGAGKIRLNVEGRATLFDRAVVTHLRVEAIEAEETFDGTEARLSDLVIGEKARIASLSPACRGAERNRLLDLGLVPGTKVEIVLSSPSGSPTAYRIRGSTIALRREQSDRIIIHKSKAKPKGAAA